MKSFLLNITALALLLSACSSIKPLDDDLPKGRDEARKEDFGKLFGPEFLVFGGKQKNLQYGDIPGGGPMRVNPHLWKASLETLSFMPFASADAVGGVIITDWYSTATAPNERIKVTVYIKDRQLRADGIQIILHKETLRNGSWIVASTDPKTAHQLEDIILSKARDLKIQYTQHND